MAELKTTFRFKIAIAGDDGVGKTAIVQQGVGEKDRQEELRKANGIEDYYQYYAKNLYVKKTEFIHTGIELYIWDTEGSAGQDFLKQGREPRRADGIIVVYDIAKASTFLWAMSLIMEIKENTEAPTSVISLVGNKSDLEERRQGRIYLKLCKLVNIIHAHLSINGRRTVIC